MLIEVFLLLFTLLAFYHFRRLKRTKLPPGPPFCPPIFGHLPLLGETPPRTFLKWSSKYGPIISVQLGSYPAIVINDGQLIRKSFNMSAFAGRPQLKYIDEVSGRKGFLFSDGPKAMDQRKFMQKMLKDFSRNSNAGPMMDQITPLLDIFEEHLDKPLNVKHKFNHIVINSLWSIVAGKKFHKNDEEFQQLALNVSSFLDMSSLIEKLAVFIITVQNLLPELSGFNKNVRGIFKIRDYLDSVVKEHRRTRVAEQPRDVIDAYMDQIEKTTDPQSSFFSAHGNITIAIQDIFMAGVETSSASLEWILFYLAKYPDVQRKVQLEIDIMLERDKSFPSSDDRAKLPYVEAVMEEVSRISSVVPLANHRTLEDTELGGYVIPKGTFVVGNIYAAHHDQNVWGDPEVFRPQRFLDIDGNFIKSNDVLVFGCGKRSCIGNHLAKLQLFLYTVSIFQRFSVKTVGHLPSESGQSGFTTRVFPFQVKVSKRV